MNNQWFSKFAVWIVIALVLFAVVKQFGGATAPGNQIGYSEFLDEVQARRIKQVTLTEGGASGAEILAETTDYGIGLTDETLAQNKAGNLGLDIQKITFDNKATDFSAQLLQVKAFKPDLVLNIAVGTPVDLIMDQATTIGLLPATPMLISYDAPTRPQYWKLHAKNGEGIYFIAYYSPKAPLSDLGKAFAATYKEKYKEDPVYGALNGFGAIEIIAQGLKAAGSADPKALIKALETGTFKSWPDAPVTFPKADGVYWHNWVPPVLIMQYTKPNQDWKEADVVVAYSKK